MEGDINDDDDAILDEPAEEDENTMQHVLMLSKSLFKACEEGDLDRVKILLQSGANPNLHNEDDSEKRTPFLIAAEKGHYDIVKILLEYGADPELGTLEIGNNALHLASREGHHRVIELLLAPREEGGGGLNINSRSNIANWTALHQAASAGRVETVKFLVQRGADLEAKTSHGQTALSLAAENCKAQCVKTLLELGANPNKGDIFGQTPLFYAARIAALNVLKILVEEGNADVNILDSRGNTAFDEADKASMWECALYLWRHGAVVKSGKKGVKVGPLLWKRPRVVGTPPSARNNAACCCVGTKVYIFGGNGHKQGYVCSDPDASLHHLNIESVAHNDLYYFDVKHLETDLIIPINEKTKKNLRLNRKRMGKFLRLSEDELTVESTPESAIDDELVDSTSIQATDAYRADEDDFGYFEIFVIDSGTKGIVTFGLTDENFDLDALPGWNRHTYGYHGDDGAVFHNRGRGTPWGPRYTTGDTVGCGINFRTKEVFFTKNGEFLGVAFKECPENVLYPTIGIRNPRAKVRVNFGLQPFKFTFEVPILKVIPISSTEFCPPPQRFAHFLKLDENRLLMLGSNCMHLSTLYIFDIEKSVWSSKACIGQHPTFHYEDIPFLLNNKIYVYSGNPKNTDMSFKLTRPPELYSLDTTQPSWEWTMKVPASRKTSDDKQSDHPLDSEFRQRVEEVTYLLATYHRNSRVCVVGNEIVFVSSQKMLKLDPETMKYSESELEGKRPTAQYYSTTVVNKDIVTFGGWDEREQQFDVYILDTERKLWYKPHVDGPVPRPRNNHSAAFVESEQIIAYFGGWNGRNFIDDIDLLSIGTLLNPDEISRYFNSQILSDVKILINGTPLYLHKAVLYARSSFFRKLFEADPCDETLHFDDVPLSLFTAMAKYLYSDVIDYALVQEEFYREFIEICEKYAEEHVPRITEELLLTRVRTPSTMHTDFSKLFNNQLFADVTFSVGGDLFYAHKVIICARSEYFRALCLGGLRESTQKRIEIYDTSSIAFKTLLEYLYKKQVDYEQLGSNIVDVFVAASKFGCVKLKEELELVIAANLTVENVSSLLIVADQQAASKLKQQCCNFIHANYNEIIKTDEYKIVSETVNKLLEQRDHAL